MKPLPPPTMEERAAAAVSARQLRAMLAGAPKGEESVAHINRGRKQHLWVTRWANLPGFALVNRQFEHDLLPGWRYTAGEIGIEMIPDLELLAERGVRPTQATR